MNDVNVCLKQADTRLAFFVQEFKNVWQQSRAKFNFTLRWMLNKFSMDSSVDLLSDWSD